MNITKTTTVGASPEAVWAVIGDFGALVDWHPWVPNCTMGEDGKTRTIALSPLDAIEVLTRTEDFAQHYTVAQSPMAIADYSASLRVESEGEGSRITWTADFRPLDETAAGAVGAFFAKGLSSLDKHFR